MKNIFLLHLLIIFLVTLAGCSSDSINGKWIVVKGEGDFPKSVRFDFRRGENVQIDCIKGVGCISTSYTLNESAHPHQITVGFGDYKYEGIYKVGGNKLTLKLTKNDRLKPPSDFNNEPEYMLLELEPWDENAVSNTASQPTANTSTTETSTISTPMLKATPKPTPTLDEEAQKETQKWFDKRVHKCGEYYRAAIHEVNTVWFPQITKEPDYSVQGNEIPPRELSEADRLNGVDPQPVQWEGEITLSFGPYRNANVYGDKVTWNMWQDSYQIHATIYKAKGEWHFRQKNPEPLPFKCEDIPNNWR